MNARFLVLLALFAPALPAQLPKPAPSESKSGRQLQYVIYLSRHGVRSPTGKTAQYNQYSAAPWPEWSVQPGYLTAHGYQLMKLFGAYDRAKLAADGLFAPTGCEDSAHVTILADSDQRTRETGKAIAEGMFPGCTIDVQARAEGSNDPIFHPLHGPASPSDRSLATAALAGRIGGDANNLTAAYRSQLEALDAILAGCNAVTPGRARTSLLDIPATLGEGSGDHLASMKGPVTVASSLSENLLLEYTEGMKDANLAWGCMDAQKLRFILQLHSAAADFTERTPAIARGYSANLLNVILKSMEQSASGKKLDGAPGKPQDRLLFLAGHDTNIASVAGALGLTWIIDGRRDDTPPGGALIFELWRSPTDNTFSVRVFYTTQTLDQMREATALTLENPPPRVPVFVPGCGAQDGSCTLDGFAAAVHDVVDTQLRGQHN